MLKKIVQKLDPEQDAIDLLKEDHRKVEALFKEFKEAKGRTKLSLAKQICNELDVHAKVEEKLFYPTAKRQAPESTDDVNEGIVEHEGIKRLVKLIPTMSVSDELFDSRMTVLEEYVKHHVKEEESTMFPKIVESDIDLKALGKKLQNEKQKLLSSSRPAKPNGSAASARQMRQ
jgi:hemerythrin superfamily protein